MNRIFLPKDLALLKIDPPFEENDKIKAIKINDVYEDLVGKEVLISGWGKTTTKDYPKQLRSLKIKIADPEEIPLGFGGYGVIQMFSSKGEGACMGDSGGNHAIQLKILLLQYIILHHLLNKSIILTIFIFSNLLRPCSAWR